MTCKMRTCVHKFINTTYNTRVCMECGVERAYVPCCTLDNVGYKMTHSPFVFGYSRVKRFSQMTTNLLFPACTQQDNAMLQHLYEARGKIRTREDLNTLIHAAPLRDKRFGSLHFFCKKFVCGYQLPPLYGCLFQIQRRMCFVFERIALAFQKKFPSRPFVNYNFLTRYILTSMGLEYYKQYVKQLKCKKRQKHYTDVLAGLGFPS